MVSASHSLRRWEWKHRGKSWNVTAVKHILSLYWLWPTWGIVGCSLIASMQIFKPPDVLHMCQDTPVKIGRPWTLISHRDVTDCSLPPNPQPISVFLFRFGLFDGCFPLKKTLVFPLKSWNFNLTHLWRQFPVIVMRYCAPSSLVRL